MWAATAVVSITNFITRKGKSGRDKFLEQLISRHSLDSPYAFVLHQACGNVEEDAAERLEASNLFLGFLVVAVEPLPFSAIVSLLGLHDYDTFDAHWFFTCARSV